MTAEQHQFQEEAENEHRYEEGKKCVTCGELKPFSEYYKNAKSPDGHKNECKECTKKRNAEARNKNKKIRSAAAQLVEALGGAGKEDEENAGNMADIGDDLTFDPDEGPGPDHEYCMVDFTDYPDLKEWLVENAKADFRTPDQQILYLLNQARSIAEETDRLLEAKEA